MNPEVEQCSAHYMLANEKEKWETSHSLDFENGNTGRLFHVSCERTHPYNSIERGDDAVNPYHPFRSGDPSEEMEVPDHEILMFHTIRLEPKHVQISRQHYERCDSPEFKTIYAEPIEQGLTKEPRPTSS